MLSRAADSALHWRLVRIAASLLVLLLACGRPADRGSAAPPGREADTAAAPAAEPPPGASAAAEMAPPPPPLTEVTARELLAGALRERGLRILQDVRIQGPGYDVTLDGWDPARKIGFEYIAPEEVDTDVDDPERGALAADPAIQVLILDAAAEPAVQARLDAFEQALR
jgi:hypothetical protein